MKKSMLMGAVVAVIVGAGAHAYGVTFSDGGVALQGLLDQITKPTASNPSGDSNVNVNTDQLSDAVDSYWTLTAAGASVSTMVLELATHSTSSFGVFCGTSSVQLFGAAGIPGCQVSFSLLENGDGTFSVEINHVDTGVDFATDHFGYYLDATSVGGGLYYSDSTMNFDGSDHMAAYRGEGDLTKLPLRPAGRWTDNEYLLAWEDMPYLGLQDGPTTHAWDAEYTDFVVMIESIQPAPPVPEPATVSLLGLGLVGFMVRRLRRS